MKGKSVAMFMEHEDTKLFDKSLVTGIHHHSTECCGTSRHFVQTNLHGTSYKLALSSTTYYQV